MIQKDNRFNIIGIKSLILNSTKTEGLVQILSYSSGGGGLAPTVPSSHHFTKAKKFFHAGNSVSSAQKSGPSPSWGDRLKRKTTPALIVANMQIAAIERYTKTR